jgi:hypothetical protein
MFYIFIILKFYKFYKFYKFFKELLQLFSKKAIASPHNLWYYIYAQVFGANQKQLRKGKIKIKIS